MRTPCFRDTHLSKLFNELVHRIFRQVFAATGTACVATVRCGVTVLCRVIVFCIGRQLYPFQAVTVHEGAGVGLVRQPLPFGRELHTHGLHLLVEVKVRQVLHALRVERIAEVAQPLDVDTLALCHARVHHACDVAQHGLHVRVIYCGYFRQILCDGLRFHGLALHDGLRVVNALLLLKCFFPKRHSLTFLIGRTFVRWLIIR